MTKDKTNWLSSTLIKKMSFLMGVTPKEAHPYSLVGQTVEEVAKAILDTIKSKLPPDFDMQYCTVTKKWSSFCNKCTYCKHRDNQDYSEGFNECLKAVRSALLEER